MGPARLFGSVRTVPPGTFPAPAPDQLNYAFAAITDALLHFVVAFGGRLNEDRLRDALMAAYRHSPVLNSRFCEADPPYWAPLHTTGPADGFRVHPTGDPGRALRAVLATPLDATRGPQLRLDLVMSDTDTLCITLHHAAGDARALLDCARLLAALYRERGSPRGTPVIAGPGNDRSNDRYHSLALQRTGGPAPEKREAVSDPWIFPVRSFDGRARDFAIRTLPPEYLARARAYGKARSATVNEVLLAAVTLALRDHRTPRSPGHLTLHHSLDLRRHYLSQETPAAGEGGAPAGYDISNHSVPLTVVLPCDDRQTLDSLTPLARAAMQQHREDNSALLEVARTEAIAQGGFAAVKDYAGWVRETNFANGGGSPFFVNVGIIPEPCADFGPDLPVTNAVATAGIVVSPPGIVLGAGTFREQMTFSLGYCPDAIPPETARGFLDAVIAALP